MMRRIPRAAPEVAAALPLAVSACWPADARASAASPDALQQMLDAARREQQLRELLVAQVGRALAALLSEELALRPEHIRGVVERELGRVQRAHRIELRLHPEDAALLGDADAFSARLGLAGALQIVPDPALARGGCTLDSDFGQIDARLETRIELALARLAQGAPDAR